MSAALENLKSGAEVLDDCVYVVTIDTADGDPFYPCDERSKHTTQQTVCSKSSDRSESAERPEHDAPSDATYIPGKPASELKQKRCLSKSPIQPRRSSLRRYTITILTTLIALSSLIFTALALWPALRSRTTEMRSIELEEWTALFTFIQYCEDKASRDTTTVSDACVLALSKDLGPPPIVVTATQPLPSRVRTASEAAASSTIDPAAPYQNSTATVSAASSAVVVVTTAISPASFTIALETVGTPGMSSNSGGSEYHPIWTTTSEGRGWTTLVSSPSTVPRTLSSARTRAAVEEEASTNV